MNRSKRPHVEYDDRSFAPRCVEMALAGIDREYPNHVSLVMTDDSDARPPRELTPIFYGCFDWHSAVHSHWSIVRWLHCGYTTLPPELPYLLSTRFTDENVASEVHYIGAPHRKGFERPYGLAWLLQLCAELREWDSAEAMGWLGALAPLEQLVAERLHEWLPGLIAPIRSGEHSQTAFALGLMHDWAVGAGEDEFLNLINERSREFYGNDVDAPIAYEPSGYDFVSPVLAEADVMRRVLDPDEFETWFERFLPRLDSDAARRWLAPVVSPDPSDGKQSHLEGLNLSRAFMLEGIAARLPDGHPSKTLLADAAGHHARAGLQSIQGDHYMGTHWLGSFATYLMTRRGIEDAPA